MAAGGRTNVVSENPLHPKSQVGKHLQNNSQSTGPVEARNGYFDRIPHGIFDGFRNGCRSSNGPTERAFRRSNTPQEKGFPPNEARTTDQDFIPDHECKP